MKRALILILLLSLLSAGGVLKLTYRPRTRIYNPCFDNTGKWYTR